VHFEDVNCGSFNVLFAERDGIEDMNCHAEWTVVSPRDAERFHQLLKKNGWDHHKNFWVTDEALKKHEIEFTKMKQRSGDAVITNYLSPHWVHWIDVSLHLSTANHPHFTHSPPASGDHTILEQSTLQQLCIQPVSVHCSVLRGS
jgi:hypothetical protein